MNGCLINGCLINGCLINGCLINRCLINGRLINRCLINGCLINGCLINRWLMNGCLINGRLINRCLINGCLLQQQSRSWMKVITLRYFGPPPTQGSTSGLATYKRPNNGWYLNGTGHCRSLITYRITYQFTYLFTYHLSVHLSLICSLITYLFTYRNVLRHSTYTLSLYPNYSFRVTYSQSARGRVHARAAPHSYRRSSPAVLDTRSTTTADHHDITATCTRHGTSQYSGEGCGVHVTPDMSSKGEQRHSVKHNILNDTLTTASLPSAALHGLTTRNRCTRNRCT